MSPSEFSEQFEVLYNNITSNKAPGLDEYEKSVFLTKGQEELIKNHFNPRSNNLQEGFDDSNKRQADYSNIIYMRELNEIEGSKFDKRASIFEYPDDVFIMLNEQIYSGGIPYVVVPISYEEYSRLMAKPYKYPPKNMAWRLLTNVYENDNTKTRAEIIGVFKESTITYNIRYVKRPYPIILTNLSNIQQGLTIQGKTTPYSNTTGSELPEELHSEILQRAVELAKVAWTSDMGAVLQVGGRSE